MSNSLLSIAEKRLLAAKHIAQVSYPSIEDPKLLMGSIIGLEEASRYIMSALLQKKDVFDSKEFNSNFHKLKALNLKGFSLSTSERSALKDVHTIFLEHSDSNVEFSRDGKFYLADADFHLDSIDSSHISIYIKDIETLLNKSKEVIKDGFHN